MPEIMSVAPPERALDRLRRQVRARPLTTVLAPVFTVFFLGVGLPRLLGRSIDEAHLHVVLAVLAVVLLFGSALAVSWLADGRAGVVLLLRRMTTWRIGWLRLVVVVVALPVLTLSVAAATGSLQRPADGWFALLASYAWDLVVLQVLSTNLWEEGLWSGFVQVRLMQRHRLLTAALLTAVPFVLLHVPVTFQNVSAGAGLVQLAALVCLAPFLRYLAGVLLAETGSVLAVGLLHASFNASGHLGAADGGWQFIPALVLLTVLVAAARLRKRRSQVTSPSPAPAERNPIVRPEPSGRS